MTSFHIFFLLFVFTKEQTMKQDNRNTAFEELAKTYSDWTRCAESWKEIGDDAGVQRCMARAEELAKTFNAGTDDSDEFSKHLTSIGFYTPRVDGWTRCATAWKEIGDNAGMHRCMARAEELAEDSWDWAYCAKTWKEIGDDAGAQQCIARAEGRAETFSDWTDCAYQWWRFIRDAEPHTSYKVIVYDAGVQRCLARAEKLAEASWDWADCAKTWQDIGDNTGVQRCMARAEKLAETSSDWTDCASAWKEIGDEAGVQRYIARAEELAKTSWDKGDGDIKEPLRPRRKPVDSSYRFPTVNAPVLYSTQFPLRDLCGSSSNVPDGTTTFSRPILTQLA